MQIRKENQKNNTYLDASSVLFKNALETAAKAADVDLNLVEITDKEYDQDQKTILINLKDKRNETLHKVLIGADGTTVLEHKQEAITN